MKTYSIISDNTGEIFLNKYCKDNNIILRKYSNGFADYDWYIAELSKKDVKILKENGLKLLKKTIFNRRKIDFFIDSRTKR